MNNIDIELRKDYFLKKVDFVYVYENMNDICNGCVVCRLMQVYFCIYLLIFRKNFCELCIIL